MIHVRAYWVPLGKSDKPVVNAFFILDIKCLWYKRSVIFHIHLKNTTLRPKNGMIVEHGFGEPNLHGYEHKENEIREVF
jgi:hypothetical protein